MDQDTAQCFRDCPSFRSPRDTGPVNWRWAVNFHKSPALDIQALCHLLFFCNSRIYSSLKSSFAVFAYYSTRKANLETEVLFFSLFSCSSGLPPFPSYTPWGVPEEIRLVCQSGLRCYLGWQTLPSCKLHLFFFSSFVPFPLLFTYHLGCLQSSERSYKFIKSLCFFFLPFKKYVIFSYPFNFL